MDELTGFQRDLLFVAVGKDEPKGATIRDELAEMYESGNLEGRVYQNLDELVDESLLEKGRKDGRTNYYAATEEAEALIENRREWEAEYLENVDLDVDATTT